MKVLKWVPVWIMVVLGLVLMSVPVIGQASYRLWWGGQETASAYPNATSAIVDYTVNGAASAHLALDDGQPVGPAFDSASSDDDSTYVSCAAVSTGCSMTLDLADLSANVDNRDIETVGVYLYHRSESAGGDRMTDVYYRINSTNYAACTNQSEPSDSYGIDLCGETHTNPDTGLAWTRTGINGMQLLIDDIGSASVANRITMAGVGVAVSGQPGRLHNLPAMRSD